MPSAQRCSSRASCNQMQASPTWHALHRNTAKTFRPKKNTPVGAKVAFDGGAQQMAQARQVINHSCTCCHCTPAGPPTQAAHRCYTRAREPSRSCQAPSWGRYTRMAGSKHSRLLQCHFCALQHTGGVLHRAQLRGHVSWQQGALQQPGQGGCLVQTL